MSGGIDRSTRTPISGTTPSVSTSWPTGWAVTPPARSRAPRPSTPSTGWCAGACSSRAPSRSTRCAPVGCWRARSSPRPTCSWPSPSSSGTRRAWARPSARALVVGDSLVIGQVGDSRVYQIRAGRAEQITEDGTLIAWQIKQDTSPPTRPRCPRTATSSRRAVGSREYVEVDTFVVALGRAIATCSAPTGSTVLRGSRRDRRHRVARRGCVGRQVHRGRQRARRARQHHRGARRGAGQARAGRDDELEAPAASDAGTPVTAMRATFTRTVRRLLRRRAPRHHRASPRSSTSPAAWRFVDLIGAA